MYTGRVHNNLILIIYLKPQALHKHKLPFPVPHELSIPTNPIHPPSFPGDWGINKLSNV